MLLTGVIVTSGEGPRGRFSSCCACNWMLAPPSDALRPRGPMPFSSCRVGGCSRDCSWKHRQRSYQPCTGSFQYLSPKVTNPDTGTKDDKPSGLQERRRNVTNISELTWARERQCQRKMSIYLSISLHSALVAKQAATCSSKARQYSPTSPRPIN